jgi:hypothetical protein
MPVARGDVPYIRGIQATLNSAIRRAAAATGSIYVDFAKVSEGHDACQPAGVRWIEPALLGNNPIIVHPNALGEAALFRWMHAGHHRSRQPTPFASFAFDPAEAVATAWLLPALALVIPIHIGVLIALLMLMTVTAIMNHSGWEILPARFVDGQMGRHLITATHHSLHHTSFGANYGLYFRFWDRLMGTDAMPPSRRDGRSGDVVRAEDARGAP